MATKPPTAAPGAATQSTQMTTSPKYVNGKLVGYYHIYSDRTVFVPVSTQTAAGAIKAGNPLLQTEAGALKGSGPTLGDGGGGTVDDSTPDFRSSPQYQARINHIIKTRDDALTNLAGRRGGIKKDFGIEDASDPYSKAKLLADAFTKNKAATSASLASRGQLYAGATQNAQNINQENLNRSQDSMQKAYNQALDAVTQQENDVRNTSEGDQIDAGSNALDQLLATRPNPDLTQISDITDVGAAETGGDAPLMQSALKPKSGYNFVAKSGPHKGVSYNVVKSGSKVYHSYSNGKKVRVK